MEETEDTVAKWVETDEQEEPVKKEDTDEALEQDAHE